MQAEAFQFLRLHPHPARAAHGLLAEVDRVEGYCSHIERPRPARWLMGSAAEVQFELGSFREQRQLVRQKSGEVRYRKMRSDLRCLIDGVASYPVEVKCFRHASNREKQDLKEWLKRANEFIQCEFGPHHVASCLHTDESHPHFHFYIVGNASRLHPGLRAEFVDGRRIEDARERKRRYISGLKAFLDRYYAEVSCWFGHSRGDGRRTAPQSLSERIISNGEGVLSDLKKQRLRSTVRLASYSQGQSDVGACLPQPTICFHHGPTSAGSGLDLRPQPRKRQS